MNEDSEYLDLDLVGLPDEDQDFLDVPVIEGFEEQGLELDITAELSQAQYDFVHSEATLVNYVAGLGAGKSFASILRILRQPAGTEGIACSISYGLLHRTLHAELLKIVPSDFILEDSSKFTVLADGKKIHWLTLDNPDAARGVNVSWIAMDEIAFSNKYAFDVVYARARVGEHRNVFTTTTPNGLNFYYDIVTGEKYSNKETFYGSTRDNPALPKSYILDLESGYDPALIEQELNGKFVDLVGAKRIPSLDLNKVYDERKPLGFVKGAPAELRVYLRPRPDRKYVLGIDVSHGLPGGDDSAITVKDASTFESVAHWSGKLDPKTGLADIAVKIALFYAGSEEFAGILPERNDAGMALIGGIENHRDYAYGMLLKGSDGREGFHTNKLSKSCMFGDYHSQIRALGAVGHKVIFDRSVKTQVSMIDRMTLRHPEKGTKPAVDDEAISEVLAGYAALNSTPFFFGT